MQSMQKVTKRFAMLLRFILLLIITISSIHTGFTQKTYTRIQDALTNHLQVKKARFLVKHSTEERLNEQLKLLANLEELTLISASTSNSPEALSNFKNLSKLIIKGSLFTELKTGTTLFKNLKELEILGSRISTIPSNLFNDSLITFTINNSRLEEIPKEICNCKNLEKLDVSFNKIQSIPDCIFSLSNLTELNLEGNQIDRISKSLTKLRALKTLNLSSNKLRNKKLASMLPDSLETLRISFNPAFAQIKNALTNSSVSLTSNEYDEIATNEAFKIEHNKISVDTFQHAVEYIQDSPLLQQIFNKDLTDEHIKVYNTNRLQAIIPDEYQSYSGFKQNRWKKEKGTYFYLGISPITLSEELTNHLTLNNSRKKFAQQHDIQILQIHQWKEKSGVLLIANKPEETFYFFFQGKNHNYSFTLRSEEKTEDAKDDFYKIIENLRID